MPEVFLNGREGRIEGRYTQSDPKRIALVLHPHPLYGGTLHNKIVYYTARVLAENGYCVLRPNFRGVGRSEGSYGNGEGELFDAVDSLDWLQGNNPEFNTCVVAGFSFGAFIAIQLLMRRPEINWFAAVAPPVKNFDMSFISPSPAPGLIIQGSEDEIVPAHSVESFVEKLRGRNDDPKVDYHLIDGCDHFFTNRVPEVTDLIDAYSKSYSNK